MSIPQTNFGNNNNRMANYAKNIDNILGYVLIYSVIIFTLLSALLGGIVIYPFYLIIYIIKKIREKCCKSASNEMSIASEVVNLENELSSAAETNEISSAKKPIIDENWCNVSVKNIINYTSEAEVVNSENEIQSEAEEDEILSIRRPSEEELRQFQKEDEDENEIEAEDTSPNDKYSLHYKSDN